ILCNLMRFSAFRQPLLTKLFSPECAAGIAYDDFETQVHLGRLGRADIVIANQSVSAIVEVKVEDFCGVTENQPNGYLSYLANQDVPERWLAFIVPPRWAHRRELDQALGSAKHGSIRTRVLSWEDVLGVIELGDLQNLSPFIDEFYRLLC